MNIGIIRIINIIYKKKKFDGQIFLLYLGWYGLGRGLIEFLRADSLLIFGQKMFVYLGFGCFIISIALYVYLRKNSKAPVDELEEYKKVYQASANANEGETEDGDNTWRKSIIFKDKKRT